MVKPKIEDFIYKKNPSGSAYLTLIEGSFGCSECDEVVKKATWSERTGEVEYTCSSGHTSKVKI